MFGDIGVLGMGIWKTTVYHMQTYVRVYTWQIVSSTSDSPLSSYALEQELLHYGSLW